MKKSSKETTVEAYIANASAVARPLLAQMRELILQAAPKATESISYQMPAYQWHGPLVYFGAYKKHIGFYPTGAGVAHFEEQLKGYVTSKGAIQFSLDKPLPVQLIKQIVQFRVKQNEQKAMKAKAK